MCQGWIDTCSNLGVLNRVKWFDLNILFYDFYGINDIKLKTDSSIYLFLVQFFSHRVVETRAMHENK